MSSILFDNDGTLIQSEFLCCQAIAAHYREEKNLSLDPESMFQRFRGWELALILDTIQEDTGTSWDEAFVQGYRKRMKALFEEQLQAVEGIPEALAVLPQKKAVVSNGPLQKVKDSLRITHLDKYFEGSMFSAYEVKIWKPDPGLFLHAATQLGEKPGNCIVVEDSPVGVEGAVAAGMHTIFYNVHDETFKHEKVSEIQSMRELPNKIMQIETIIDGEK